MRVFNLFLLLTFVCPHLWAQVVDKPMPNDSIGIEEGFIKEDNAIDPSEIREANESVNEVLIDSVVDSVSQEINQAGADSVTRSSWYEIVNSTDSLSTKDTVLRERGSPDSVRASYSTPLMPDLQSAQPFNQTKRNKRQQDGFIDREYYYPAKPKHAWSLGIRGGTAMINGDINQNFFRGTKPFAPGYTFGVFAKKATSYFMSLRLNYAHMRMWNTDWQPSVLTSNLVGAVPELIAYTDTLGLGANHPQLGNRVNFYHNSYTVSHDMTFDVMFSLGGARFHKERSKVLFNVFISAGGFLYRTRYDHYDENGQPYNYGNIPATNTSKPDILNALEDMQDGVYETDAENDYELKAISFLNGFTFNPSFGFGGGFTFRVNRFIDLDLETRMMYTTSDLLDGHRWSEPFAQFPGQDLSSLNYRSNGVTKDKDAYATATIGITFKLIGKQTTEPLTHLNPFQFTYERLNEINVEKSINEALADDDDDGVINRLDEEENTPEDAPVDTKGRALDSDDDGIIDLYDKEKYSIAGLPVDSNGVAHIPIIDPDDPEYEEKVKELPQIYQDLQALINNSSQAKDCEDITEFPTVHFAQNYYSIDPAYYAHLHVVGALMQRCHDLNIMITGKTDYVNDDDYNIKLSYNRAMEVMSYLSEKYDLPCSRFELRYIGEEEAIEEEGLPLLEYRQVEFKIIDGGTGTACNPEDPFPTINAGLRQTK